jgi:crotonobetainyl-CoA:carnitine CoA-transferase CaiB-like acyl-CoA transferase
MKPLAGLRIADFTIHAAGPFGTHLLAQLGAECIKIESTARPDIFRKPHPVYGRLGPATFDQVSAAKLSVRINLKHPEGRRLALSLVQISDLAAESFRPGVMDRLGLGYTALKAVRDDVILLSVSSSGQTGPDCHYAGYAPLFGAWGGLGFLTGHADGPPVEMRHVMDHSVGLNAAIAALSALIRRRRTGAGTHVDVAAREVAASLIGESLLEAAAGLEPEREGNSSPAMAPHGVYPTRDPDRWVSIAVASDSEWTLLHRELGPLAPADSPASLSLAQRLGQRPQLDQVVASWSAGLTAEEAAVRLQALGIAAHPVWSAADIVRDPHLRARGAIVDVPENERERRAAVGLPVMFGQAPQTGISRGTPALGQDEEYVFGELLGLTRSRRTALEEDGAIS